MIAEIALTMAAAWIYTELIGYWLHKLLHSDTIRFLSRNHMIHHLKVYSATKPMRQSRSYLDSTEGRANLLGIGLEWLAPVAVIMPATLLLLRAAGMSPWAQALFIVSAMAWGYFMFGYIHDSMHLQDFWMERHPLFKGWYLAARKRHDIHHMRIDDAGLMTKNFGICFFWFDRLFRSLADEHRRFNKAGYEAALKRYAFIFDDPKPVSR